MAKSNTKIIAWNVNSVGVRLERLLRLLETENPDFLCLQELKCIDEKFPAEAIGNLGYSASVFGQRTYNGVAVISKEAPREVFRGMGDGSPDEAARLIGARFDKLTVVSAYVPNGQAVGSEKFAYKMDWLARARAFFDRTFQPTDPVVLAGDFNIAPEDADVHDPDLWRGKILFSEAEHTALKKLKDFGLHDTFRKHYPDGSHFSWWDYRMGAFHRNHGLRIDFVLATKPLLDKCTAAAILRDERKGEKPSDHAPVVAEFSL